MDFIELNIWAVPNVPHKDDAIFDEDYLTWTVNINAIRSFIGVGLDVKHADWEKDGAIVDKTITRHCGCTQIYFDEDVSKILRPTLQEIEITYYVAETYESLRDRIINKQFKAPECDF